MLINKASACQYYSSRGCCTVLKLKLEDCPVGCSFFQVREKNYTPPPDIIEECRFLQQEGIHSVCCKKGVIMPSCTACQYYESLDDYDHHPPVTGSMFQTSVSSFDEVLREVDVRREEL